MSESLYDCNFRLQSCRMMYDPEFGLAIYNFFVSQSEDESEGGLVDARLRQDLNFGSKKMMALENDTELSVSRETHLIATLRWAKTKSNFTETDKILFSKHQRYHWFT